MLKHRCIQLSVLSHQQSVGEVRVATERSLLQERYRDQEIEIMGQLNGSG